MHPRLQPPQQHIQDKDDRENNTGDRPKSDNKDNRNNKDVDYRDHDYRNNRDRDMDYRSDKGRGHNRHHNDHIDVSKRICHPLLYLHRKIWTIYQVKEKAKRDL